MQTSEVATYYEYVTDSYTRYSPGALGWHYGVWEPGVVTHYDAILQSNRVLLRSLDITPDTRILDVGCGVGGFATWAAAEFGCRVTGITNVPLHLTMAWQIAFKRGVSDLCDFILMDMSSMTFPDQRFDIVINQETLCYAVDKLEYLRLVHDILRPGGFWRAIEFSVQDEPLSEKGQKLYRIVRNGFYIPSLLSAVELKLLLKQASYVEAESLDLTDLVGRTARGMIRSTYSIALLMRLRLDWLAFSKDPERRRYYQGHLRAGLAYSRGLLNGCFRHNLYSARRSILTDLASSHRIAI
ncbi:MAG: methyltransferase domain-containing protein [Dehalococcoidia bacterium]|nr:methyltransferase domain-containing protein [Dehalococcoidia bacterium]